jgi:hypothetical protein
MLLVIASKYPTNSPTTPAGWTLLGQATGGAGASGVDTGNVYCTVYYKDSDGTESGTLTVSLPSGNVLCPKILSYTKAAGTVWDIAFATGAVNAGGTTAWSVTAGSDPGFRIGDRCIAVNAINSDAYTYTGHAISIPGVTTNTASERTDAGTSFGDDVYTYACDFNCSAGTSSGNAVFTATASGSAADAPAGATVFVRLRETTAGSTAITFGQSGDLAGAGALASTAGLSFSQSGSLAGAGAASASGGLVVGQSGALLGAGALGGSATAAVGQTGTLSAVGVLSGSSAIALGQSGNLAAPSGGGVSGGAGIGVASTGTMAGSGVLAGAIAITIGQTGRLRVPRTRPPFTAVLGAAASQLGNILLGAVFTAYAYASTTLRDDLFTEIDLDDEPLTEIELDDEPFTLITTETDVPGPYNIGDVAILRSTHRVLVVSGVRVLTNATTEVLTVRSPANVVTTPAVTNTSTGRYWAPVPCTEAGTWRYRWTGTGTAIGVEEGIFVVLPNSF